MWDIGYILELLMLLWSLKDVINTTIHSMKIVLSRNTWKFLLDCFSLNYICELNIITLFELQRNFQSTNKISFIVLFNLLFRFISSVTHSIGTLGKIVIYVGEILLSKHRGNSSHFKCTLEWKQISQQIMPGGKCKNHINAFQILIEK